jgi:hypothetical protein
MWLDVCGLALGWCRAHTWQRGSEGRESVGGEGERLTGYSALSKQLVKNENTQFCQGACRHPISNPLHQAASGQQRVERISRASPPHRLREDRLVYPADASRTNLAALALLRGAPASKP